MPTGGMKYALAVKRKFVQLVVISAAIAILVWVIAGAIRPGAQVHFSYLVSLAERENPSEYTFDGYYAIQATDLFTATVAKWISTPEVIRAAYEEAGLSDGLGRDPRELTRSIRADKTAPQLIEVTIHATSEDKALGLAEALMAVMDRNIDQYHDQGIPALTFRVVATKPLAGSVALAKNPIAFATFVFSIFIGVNIVLIIESFQEETGSVKSKSNTW